MTPRMKYSSLAAAALVATLFAAPALAGGPLGIFDPQTRTPYGWPAGVTPVYTDLGELGQLTNEQAAAMIAYGWQQWNEVPTSTFQAEVVGDFGDLGLGDIDASNIDQVLGVWNGGGIHVVYDAHGEIVEGLFGLYGVLGFSVLEWVDEDSPAILEATVVFNGNALPSWLAPDQAAAAYAGVVTHEFGHALGLAHSQTNGQLIFFYDVDMNTYLPNTGAAGCTPPYPGVPDASRIDTMYPFSSITWNGADQATVDIKDDISAISDIYPVDGWPEAYPGITGTIYRPDGTSPQMGTNVIARNNDDPWTDAISGLAGDLTQGELGEDGVYVFNGLTAGANYTIYVDGIVAGAFSTPYATVLPGPEEFFNGAAESGNMFTDNRCEATPVVPATGSPAVADIIFNTIKGGPRFHAVDLPSSGASSISADGSVVIGGSGAGMWRWTPSGGFELIGGAASSFPSVSHNGLHIAGEIINEDGFEEAAIWQGGAHWMPIGGLPDSTGCDMFWSSSWGVSDNAVVAGLAWDGCTFTTAYTWDETHGIFALPMVGGGSRADDISADGRTVVGWDKADNGFWRGAIWQDGVETLVEQEPVECCNLEEPWCPGLESNVSTASAVNSHGDIVVGEGFNIPKVWVDSWSGQEYKYCVGAPWRWTEQGGVESLGEWVGQRPSPADLTDDGKIVVGSAWPDDPWGNPTGWIWTGQTGYMPFSEFLATQGVFPHEWIIYTVSTISADGRTIGGGALTPFSFQGWILEMDRAMICHRPPGNPKKQRTQLVSFPDSVWDHLNHGDTIGMCGNGVY